jgi:hypothetical protein
MIRKPIGARLPMHELPGGSFVKTEVIEGPDGLPDLRLTHPLGRYVDVSISDLSFILRWAERE